MTEACLQCLRRSWLLGELSAVLDRNCRADDRLFELLALEDEELIAALGGRRREELLRRHAGLRERDLATTSEDSAVCGHSERYPKALRGGQDAPRMLHVSGGLDRLGALADGPTAALLGTSRPSAYGIEIARMLGRELAASGVTLVGERRAGIAFAAQEGALEAGGATLLVAGDGLRASPAASRRSAYEQLARAGCMVSELPGRGRGRGWATVAGVRIAAALGGVTVVVEAADGPVELRGARHARALGRPLAAVPGPLGSSTSEGCHALLREGARLVRDASDVLDLLYGIDEPSRADGLPSTALPGLRPALRELLRRVGEGEGTLGRLTTGSRGRAEVLRDLGELELMGLLARAEGGRYVVCKPDAEPALRYGASAQMES